ncbi:hypothetical protein B0H19DRAFT_1059716 [Mycena capillaripes]|nr:hypothetical protein B0H19DRAFT_1059716 [Mycena capillaripes]
MTYMVRLDALGIMVHRTEPFNLDQSQPVQDDKYFFGDGDCMFVAGNVLFKLHKVFLSRDPESMFRDMFSIPQSSAAQGLALDPILLSGDSAENFRALCWALYALPTEIQSQNNDEANIERLVAVANMSHKYSLSSFEAWALSIVWIHCQPKRDYLDGCPENMLHGTYEAAAAGGRQDLCTRVEQKWLVRLKRGELELRHALDFGEAHNMRAFLADAYYQQARDMKPLAPKLIIGSEVADFSRLNLTNSQVQRLLSGYCSLSLFWERFGSTTLRAEKHSGHINTMDGLAIRHPEDPLDILGGTQIEYCRNFCYEVAFTCGDKHYVKSIILQHLDLNRHFGGARIRFLERRNCLLPQKYIFLHAEAAKVPEYADGYTFDVDEIWNSSEDFNLTLRGARPSITPARIRSPRIEVAVDRLQPMKHTKMEPGILEA